MENLERPFFCPLDPEFFFFFCLSSCPLWPDDCALLGLTIKHSRTTLLLFVELVSRIAGMAIDNAFCVRVGIVHPQPKATSP